MDMEFQCPTSSKSYAILGNGGFNVEPTILKKQDVKLGPRVLKEKLPRDPCYWEAAGRPTRNCKNAK